jgi:outer membrane protein insertion porin family/translocation and assembly module TamA
MRRLALAWTCVVALATTAMVASAQAHAPEPEVRRLVLEGVTHVDVQDLQKSISTTASRCRSWVIQIFCWVSRSPTFEDRFYLDPEELQRDVIRIRLYYWERGWRDAEVDTAITPMGARQVKVTFKVTEGPPTTIRKLSMVYDSSLISERTRNRLTLLHANDPLDLIRLDSMRVMFQNAMWDQGYGDAVVDTTVVVDTSRHLADVSLKFTPNHRTVVGNITITGTHRVNPQTVRNAITFRTGDIFRLSDVLESQRNLYESSLFRLATIQVLPQPDSVKDVDIGVTEAPLHEVRIGPGLNSVDFLQLQAHYTAYDLFGGARRLDVDATVGNLLAGSLEGRAGFRNVTRDVGDTNVSPFLQPTYATSIDFKQPAFLRPTNSVGVGAFAHRTINPGVFIDQGYGGQATFTHEIRPRAPVSVNYRYEENRVDASDVYFCVNYGVCDTLTIGTLRSHHSLAPATLTGFVDRSDQPFSPTKGYVARFDYENAAAWTGSDYRYNRVFFDVAAYGHRSGTKNVYSAHLRFGWVRPITTGIDSGVLHPRKRFYAGGANSVRGYQENQLGPRILTIEDSTLIRGATSIGGGRCAARADAVKFCDPNSPGLSNGDFFPQPLGGTSLLEGSVEYRVPLPQGTVFRNFVGAVFVDAGVVGSASIRGLQTIGNIIRGQGAITPGIGIRYMTSVGAVRVDLGFNPNRSQQLNVVTAVPDSTGQIRIVPLALSRNWVSGRTILDHLALHFSIGEAY